MRKLIYFSGVGRSGSTLLNSIMAEAPGVCSVGEYLQFGVNVQRGAYCECGARLVECPFWREIAARCDATLADLSRFSQSLQQLTRSTQLAELLCTLAGRLPQFDGSLVCSLNNILSAASDVSRSDVVIESSKAPYLIPLLARMPDSSIYVIRVVRSRRGVVASYARSKQASPAGRKNYYTQHNLLSTSMVWASKNLLSSRIERSCRQAGVATRIVRFENFLEAPVATMESLSAWVDHRLYPDSLTDTGYQKERHHSAGGNVNRYNSGWINFESQ